MDKYGVFSREREKTLLSNEANTASVFNITSKNSGCFMGSYIVAIIKKSGQISNFVADIDLIHISIDTI